ncbi:hypothetical protein [Paenibacillus sp. 1_12]|uniref:hypothetical protein n=1 Tax=Paenibacillus sp. 1_12 TaxID=1566278 RepID=UPI000B883EE1|nr:hypothetical protein [Paenibacillus sp. 1_12]
MKLRRLLLLVMTLTLTPLLTVQPIQAAELANTNDTFVHKWTIDQKDFINLNSVYNSTKHIGKDGTLYVWQRDRETQDTVVLAIGSDGRLLWQYSFYAKFFDDTLAEGADGHVFIVSGNETQDDLQVIQPDGQAAWEPSALWAQGDFGTKRIGGLYLNEDGSFWITVFGDVSNSFNYLCKFDVNGSLLEKHKLPGTVTLFSNGYLVSSFVKSGNENGGYSAFRMYEWSGNETLYYAPERYESADLRLLEDGKTILHSSKPPGELTAENTSNAEQQIVVYEDGVPLWSLSLAKGSRARLITMGNDIYYHDSSGVLNKINNQTGEVQASFMPEGELVSEAYLGEKKSNRLYPDDINSSLQVLTMNSKRQSLNRYLLEPQSLQPQLKFNTSYQYLGRGYFLQDRNDKLELYHHALSDSQ